MSIKDISHKTILNSILLLVITLLIWWALPHIEINTTHPFRSPMARVIILVLLALSLAIKHLITLAQTHKQEFVQVIRSRIGFLIQSIKSISMEWRETIKYRSKQVALDFSHRKEQNRMKKLPWYIVMGTPKSGKKSVMNKSGIHFINPKQFGREATQASKQFAEYHWWFTPSAVFVDTDIDHTESNDIMQKKFIKYLKKKRQSKPISGLLLTVDISELLVDSHEQRQAYINDIATKINTLRQALRTQIPIYLLLNKCDLIAGFTDFFHDLSKEELNQVWGMTFPMNISHDVKNVLSDFNDQFNQLMLRLQQRVLQSLDSEKSISARERIHGFPLQVQLFKKPIQTFISELFASIQHPNSILLRGTYFCSTQQTQQPQDFLLSIIGKQYALSHNPIVTTHQRQESYFLQELFNSVVLFEGSLLGDSLKTKRLKKIAYRSSLAITPFVLAFGIIGISSAYKSSIANLNDVQSRFTTYQQAINNLRPDDISIAHTLPALNALNTAYVHTGSLGWMSNLLWSNHSLYHSTHTAIVRNVQSLFLPRVAACIETKLQQSDDQNASDLYVQLKGYLAFSDHGYTQPSTIVAPIQSHWNTLYHNNLSTLANLDQYLKMGIQTQLAMLPLNRPLIDKVRLKLQHIVPADRAYALLRSKSATSQFNDIDFTSAIKGYKEIFEASSKNQYIDRLYTDLGFKHIYIRYQNNISTQVAQDNREIGLDQTTTQNSDQIHQQMSINYNREYLRTWQKALKSITIIKADNASGVINQLQSLASNTSPLKSLLDSIDDNTNPISAYNIHISQHFTSINQFTENLNSQTSYSDILKSFKSLANYFVSLDQATDKEQAYFNAAKDYISGDQKNPLFHYSMLIKSTPLPVRGWLQSIGDNCWQVINKNAMRYINHKWQNDVINIYNSSIKHRYPVFYRADSQISIGDFNQFFGPKGTLQSFYNLYLKAFINTDTADWSVYTVGGHQLGISTPGVSVFEQAKHIIQTYFRHSATAHIEFTLRPLTLSQTASRIDFNIGDQLFSYQHGPRTSFKVSWPLNSENQDSSIVLTDFNHNRFTHHAYGTWAVFKILNQSSVNIYLSAGKSTLSTTMGGQHAAFSLDSSSSISTLKLRQLRHFRLPEQLK